MSDTNPFFVLQDRLRTLLAAHDYFAPLDASQLVVERIGDIDSAIDSALLSAGFGVIIATGSGETIDLDNLVLRDAAPATLRETLTVAIVHNPTTDTDHTALDGLWAAVQAIHGLPTVSGRDAPGAPRLRVIGHHPADDAPDGVSVQHLLVATIADYDPA